ncbi:response regulator [bacterium]|nr:response regulator [bacterium]
MKILVVEDDKELADLNSQLLRFEGFDVVTAYSGNQALKHLVETKFDAILSDVRMPEGDGVYLLKTAKLRGYIEDTHFYFYTGYADFSLKEAESMGAKDIFHKPLSVEEVGNQIKSRAE